MSWPARYACRTPRELVHDGGVPCAGCEQLERDLHRALYALAVVAGFLWWELA